MTREPRYDILFEPVTIGPKVARNRFYQPGQCNGMGRQRPLGHARMRGVKAEGGWAVIHTEHCSIHPSADMFPEIVMTLWNDDDIPVLARACDEVHAHDALFGVQLAYGGGYVANRLGREVPIGPLSRPVGELEPIQARAIEKSDIHNLHGWWRDAVRRAIVAGVDIINVNSQFSAIAFHMLSPRNRRGDENGGSLENRARLLCELIDVTREESKGEVAVTVRIIIDELIGAKGLQAHEDGKEIIEYLAEVPDLWDVIVGTWEGDSPTSRFAPENIHEPYIDFVKSVTTKPVVGVGRFTSPDTMASLIKRGVLDMIGAARPSIADPFLPRKIEEGRAEDIRECIGCNICVSSHFQSVNIRCTQNPTQGEEWRRGWHPENIAPKGSDSPVLVVGAGPAGLEAACWLGRRGYPVTLAEATTELGGRVTREAKLPGLAEWARVRDWRVGQLDRLSNVEVYRDSPMTAADVRETGAHHVVLATGAHWRSDGVGRANNDPVPGSDGGNAFSPDDIMAGRLPEGPLGQSVVVFDDDSFYMGSSMAEVLARAGIATTIVAPEPEIASYTRYTLEHERIARLLDDLGVTMVTHHNLTNVLADQVTIGHVYTGRERTIVANAVIMVTARLPDDRLYHELMADADANVQAGIASITRIGDCLAPGAIFHATYAGHRYARELDTDPSDRLFRHELPAVAAF
ncbi:MAG: FAD-dependent oxidoreductase [Pseudomonadota bacterium]|nr:FAD-dependent oxidoreductase [Pseudomonadota bacterium]